METPELKFYKIHPEALAPVYSTEDAACFDIHACLYEGQLVKLFRPDNTVEDVEITDERRLIIPGGHRALVPTGLIFVIEPGWSVRVHARSGNAIKLGLVLANGEGIIDWAYWHEALQPIINTSSVDVVIKHADRMCQAEYLKDIKTPLVETFEKPVQRTSRVGGFGSTGGMVNGHTVQA